MVILTIPLAWKILLPPAFEEFSKSVVSLVFFVSNVFFWSISGYFDTDTERKPLVHTWSLAVEEQFYVFFPLFLLLMWRLYRRHVLFPLALAALCSFTFSLWQARHDPEGNFYLAPSRVWELLTGSLCAVILSRMELAKNDILGILGLALIGFTLFGVSATVDWPGPWTILPVAGTALIVLFARAGTFTARLLSIRPMVLIGLSSYSLYLLHQPLLAFARIYFYWTPGSKRMILLSLICIPLAILSWRYVELPFRRGKNSILQTRRQVFSSSAIVASALLAFALVGTISKGTMYYYPPEISGIIGAKADHPGNECLLDAKPRKLVHPLLRCYEFTKGATIPDVIIFGDSHAWAVSKELRKVFHENGIGYYFISHQSCLPVPGISVLDQPDPTSCARFVDGVLNYAREAGVTHLVLIGRFTEIVTMTPFDNLEGGKEGAVGIYDSEPWDKTAAHKTLDQLRANIAVDVLDRLAALKREFNLVIVEPIPEAGWDVPDRSLQEYLGKGRIAEVSTSYGLYRTRNAEALGIMTALAGEHVSLVRSADVFCSEKTGRCMNTEGGIPLYTDNNHLSNRGARRLVPLILQSLRASMGVPRPVAMGGG